MDRRILVIVLCLAMARAYAQPPDYGARFKTEIEAIGQPAPDDFAAQYPPSGLEAIDYDPTSAAFFKELNLEPPEAAEGETPRPDLRLSQQELATFRRIGFVVSERLGRDSFTGLLYRVYSADLPLFVSGDAVLHAWHQSFNETFAQLELVVLAPRLEAVLTRMQGAVPEVWSAYGKGALGQSVQDADYLLAVALSLFHGKPVAPQLDQTERVRATLEQCKSEKTCNFPLFGYDRRVDFAALKVRGRYERYPKLRGYFQAMVWLKLAGLRLTEDPNADRELATALVLAELLDRSGQTHAWKRFEHILTHLVGPTDGLSLLQAHSLVHEGAALNVAAARTKLLEGSLGIEQIPSYLPNIDLTASAPRRPRMFFFTGARFTLGSWALSQTVFERVVWDQHKVMRRIPSSLDVAFGVLANDATVPELVRRLKEVEVPFRDGLNYHHSLMAVRRTIDAITEQDWNGCMPMQWLSVLRALSGPADPRAPQSMRTRAWALRSVTTQLGSWSELRHDIILDAKVSETGGTLCSYPHGYVEPRPEFWTRLEVMAQTMATIMDDEQISRDLPRLRPFYQNFARRMGTLKSISEKELAGNALNAEEETFLRQTVEMGQRSSGGMHYTGWYFTLFYKELSGRDEPELWEPTVADIHSDPPDGPSGDPGTIVLVGTGCADMLVVAVDNGPDRMIYVGPTLSFYEWNAPERLSDSQWRDQVETGAAPPRPSWTREYLVPYRW